MEAVAHKKQTSKLRRRYYYNKETNELFVETRIKSNEFKGQKSGTILPGDKMPSFMFLDLSLFPAHHHKNYGQKAVMRQYILVGQLLWVHPPSKKPFLAYVEYNDESKITYRKVLLTGKLSKKMETRQHNDPEYDFTAPMENYKVDIQIKLV